jgi:hypothetical protein
MTTTVLKSSLHTCRPFACTLVAVAALGGCTNPDSVLFVTKTSISVLDADTKPPQISIGYDRTEGFIGPRFENGAVPPVYGSIESDAAILNPKIRQLYATGDAAELVTGGKPTDCYNYLAGDARLMFFGTTTNTGLKITFGTAGAPGAVALPDSFSFGFRRKEFSLIPVGETMREDGPGCLPAADGSKVKRYPALIASIDTTGRIGDTTDIGQPGQPASDVGLQTAQFIATGAAARNLAPHLQPEFTRRASQSIGSTAAFEEPDDVSTALAAELEKPAQAEKATAFLAERGHSMSLGFLVNAAGLDLLRREVLAHLLAS